MANSIDLAKIYLANLQKIWCLESKTSILENNALVRTLAGAPADEVQLPVLSMDGLKDYSRANGYSASAINMTWATRKLTQDRGNSFQLDAMDNFESLSVAGGNILAEFERTKVIPEVDAYRFAKIAQASVAGHRAYGTLSSAENVLSAINAGIVALDNAEVPAEERVLFITPACLQYLKDKVGANRFYTAEDTNIGRKIEYFDGMAVVSVPKTRFYLGWQKNPAGGYIPEGSQLNFLIVGKSAVLPVIKHNPVRIFSPDVNQSADAYKFDYRIYHDCLIAPAKESGIYIHTVEQFTPETVDTPVIAVTQDKTASVKFTVTSPTASASFYYTLDGTDPTSASTAYSEEVTVTDTSVTAPTIVEKTLKVVAIKEGMLSSEIASKVLHVVGSKT